MLIVVAVAVVVGVYVWARLSTGGSTLARALIWMRADVGDQARFPSRPIRAGVRASPLRVARVGDLSIGVDGVRSSSLDAVVCTTHTHNNYNPLLPGLVLERATGRSVSDFMAAALWRPLGAAADASRSLDSERSGFEKLESGFSATARNYARFGLLFLHGGRANSVRIISSRWVRAATTVQTRTDYVADIVVVRLGSDWGLDNEHWLAIFSAIADSPGHWDGNRRPMSDAAKGDESLPRSRSVRARAGPAPVRPLP